MGHELRLEGRFDAPPEVVFDAFLDRRAQFGGKGRAQVESDLDLRVGGIWTLVYRWQGAEPDRETSVFSEVDRPRRLVYGQSIYSGDWRRSVDTTVTVTFEEHDGGTRFTLVQAGFESQELRDAFGSHAPGVLDALQRAVAAKLSDRRGR